jgi:hypothetical protein
MKSGLQVFFRQNLRANLENDMKKIFYCFLAVALLWCWSFAMAGNLTTSGKPNQKAPAKKSVERSSTTAPRITFAKPEGSRPQPIIDPALTSTNVGGPSNQVSNVKKNIERAPTATNPRYKDRAAAKLKKETTHKSWGVATPPDPNVILQGGDNMGDAFVISSLPFSDAGTTAGYTDDYDVACPGTATAPDVVYSYTATFTATVTISLCGNSNYDTKLYVFENTAYNTVGCNDDACSTPSLPFPFASRIDACNFTAGNTYYIVVDGYGNNSGSYTLDITGPAECTPDFTVDGPGTWTGTTCGAGNDSPLRPSEDHIYEVNLSEAGNWTFSLCNSGDMWDTYLYVGSTACSGDLGFNDDYCGPMSQATVPIPEPGTYYVTIEGFGAGDCGDYQLDIIEPQPAPENDSCSAAIPVTTYPATVCGTVAGATIDCPDNLGWPAVWYTFDAPYAMNNISVNYCGTDGMIYEVGISLFRNCDDCVFTPADEYSWNECDNGFLNPSMDWYYLPGPATYYFAAYVVGVNDFCFDVNVTEGATCDLTCPIGGIPENEPDCGDDYVDNYNGGCNSDPYVFQSYTFGDTICGKSGTYIANGMEYRDTDWYKVDLTEMGEITWNVVAEFPAQTFIYYDPYNDCNSIELAYASSWIHCDTITVSAFAAQPGSYYLWVGPLVYTGVPCGADYLAWGTLGPPPPCNPDYVITVPGTTNGTTCGMGNDWSNTCLGDYDNGQDILYEFTLASPLTVDIILDPLGTNSTGFALASDCYMQNCIAQSGSWWGVPQGVTVLPLDAGTYYIMVDMWPMMDDCIPEFNLTINESAPPPANDNCADVNPVPLLDGVPIQFTGDNTDATIDCNLFTVPEVWHAITTTECMDITIDLCGTTPPFANAYTVMTEQCPCGNQIFATDANDTECPDGNITQHYYGVPPGTYYIPVLSEVGSMGPYTLNVSGVACPPPPTPDFTVTAPGTWDGNTCGAGNDCHLLPSEDQIFQVTIPNDGIWKFSLCNTLVWWDSYLTLGTTSCSNDIATNDDYCLPLSEITTNLNAGTYFLTVEGWGTGCGEYTLDITEVIPPPNPCDSSLYVNHVQPIAAAMASQCDPYYPFQAGCADDFILNESASIDQVVVWIGLWNGPADPANITAVNVVFYADNNGVPGGRPLGADPSCGYQADINGGLISVQQVTTYTTVAEPTGLYQLIVNIAPVSLNPGTTYWLEVSPVMESSIGGQTGWAPSDMLTGNPGVQIFQEMGINEWGPPDGATIDFAFCLHGTGGGCSYTIGDANGNNVFNGLDVTYSVGYFKGGPPPPYSCDCPPHGVFYVSGDVNGSCSYNGLDVTFMVAYFKGGPVPNPCADCPPARIDLLGSPTITTPLSQPKEPSN